MVFLFQVMKAQVQKAAEPFKPVETYSLNMFKAIEGMDGVTAVSPKIAKYIEYAAKEKGYQFSPELKAKIPGKVLNDICSQPAINAFVKEYNTPPKGETMPDFEKLPQMSAKEVTDAVKFMLPTVKLK